MTAEQDKANKDLLLYGQSFMLDGKHIPLDNVLINPKMTTNIVLKEAQRRLQAYKKLGAKHMSEQDKMAFEEAMQKKFGWNNTEHILHNPSEYSDMVYQHVYYACEGWQAATTEANKRIAELELQLQNWKDFSKKVQKIDFNDYLELQASNNRLQAKLTAEKEYINKLLKSSNHLFVENEQLKAHINDLREAIETALYGHGNDALPKLRKALSTTPAESLTEHDNELLKRLRPTRWTQKMNDAWNLAIPDLHKAFDDLIESLKEVK